MSTQQMTLPARYYTDPEIFRQELETFFRSMWVCAGREEQVENPGDYFLSEVAGESIIATRDSGGALRAFYNVCRHRGTRMCREDHGKFAARIQCPYHGWTYGLDGRLLALRTWMRQRSNAKIIRCTPCTRRPGKETYS